MDFQDCIKFANENPVCYFATVENDQPRVRGLRMWFADNSGFYFQSQFVKALCKQLKKNNKVEVCFRAPEPGPIGTVLRVAGRVEFVDDMALKARVIKERLSLKEMGIVRPDDPILAVFRIYTGEAFFWTTKYSMKEAEIKRIKF